MSFLSAIIPTVLSTIGSKIFSSSDNPMMGAIGQGLQTATGMLGNLASARASSDIGLRQMMDMWRLGPAAQMAGLKDAGLNPMLAIDKLAMPTSGSFASPLEGQMAGQAAMTSSAAQAKQVDSTIEMQKATAAQAYAQARLTEFESKKINGWLNGIVNFMAGSEGFRVSSDQQVQALSEYYRHTVLPGEVQAIAADMARQLNEETLHKLINVPAANGFMRFFQTVIKSALSLRKRSSTSTSTSTTTRSGGTTSRTTQTITK